ncbi:DUF3231 family protein [Oceanobacillus picturae]|uniref:DUF3231 family protein n=1 Tax=Oceanobacillus picturae TaxID=171693 RepID=UPI00362DF4EB
MVKEHNIKLTSSEISALWAAYMNNSMNACMMKYFIEKAEDMEVRTILELSSDISNRLLQKIRAVYIKEKHPIPLAFNENDVNVEAPPLCTDVFTLNYIHAMARYGMTYFGSAFSGSVRPDVLGIFTEAVQLDMELYYKTLNLLLEKGLYFRAASIPIPERVGFVEKQKYLTGGFENRRPLNAPDIMNFYNDMQRNGIGKAIIMGFGQTANLQEVRNYMMRGAKISHVLSEENITESATWDSEVLDSTTAPFSDKIMMFHTSLLTGSSTGYYGTALGTSLRRDIATKYMRFIVEALEFAEDGTNIMINHEWMEQPPQSFDNFKMAKKKKNRM